MKVYGGAYHFCCGGCVPSLGSGTYGVNCYATTPLSVTDSIAQTQSQACAPLTYTNSSGQQLSTTGCGTTTASSPVNLANSSQLMNGCANPSVTNCEVSTPAGLSALLSKLQTPAGALTAAAALAALASGNKPSTAAYTGTVPNLTATRCQVAGTQATNGVAMGQRYFTPTQYTTQGCATALQNAKTLAQAQGQVISAADKDNAAQGATPTYTLATPWIQAQQQQNARLNAQMAAQGQAGSSGIASLPASSVTNAVPVPNTRVGINPMQAAQLMQGGPQGGRCQGAMPQAQFASGGITGIPASSGCCAPVCNAQNLGNPFQITNPANQSLALASGGIAGISDADMMRQPRYLQGATDGMADQIPTSIDNKEPALLSHGEFVIPADVVSHLGNGNSDAGAQQLYAMMDRIREARTGTKKQGKEIDPNKFMPGGAVPSCGHHAYAKGGIASIKHFDSGGTAATTTAAAGTNAANGTSTSSALSPYIGQYATNMLGQGQALAQQCMPVYTGQLTAGPSALQNQQFQGLSQLAQTGLTPTQFQVGTFNACAAQQYMNPFLQASLNPQLCALTRQSQINEQGCMAKLTQAGAYGGSRQAVLEGQDQYNLLAQQANLIGQGYNTAYNNAMNQFNTAQSQSLTAQQNQEAANEAAANYGLSTLNALGTAGATQQSLAQAADTAQLNQFQQQLNYPYAQVQFESGLLSNLPTTTSTTSTNQTTLGNILNTTGGLGSLYNTANGALSSGTTGTTSSGTT